MDNRINDDDRVLIHSFTTDHSEVFIYKKRCNTQEEVDALRDKMWRALAKVSYNNWKRTGILL